MNGLRDGVDDAIFLPVEFHVAFFADEECVSCGAPARVRLLHVDDSARRARILGHSRDSNKVTKGRV